jgi:formylglycine-generating enzyme required for sulfatase activity
MKNLTLTILLVAAVAATWAQKPDKKTVKLEKQLVGSFVEIPGAHFLTRNSKGDTMRVTIAPFRMLATEVSNASYNLFLDDLKAQGRMVDYEKAKIDTSRAKPYLQTLYYTYPTYAQYPISCISYEGAMLFCQWLTEKMGGEEWEYTLPSEMQWKFAARNGDPQHHYSAYSIASPYLTDRNGRPMYTYFIIEDSHISRQDGRLVVLEDDIQEMIKIHSMSSRWHPNNVNSLYPNDLGLYNMCGNVAEMVDERGVAFGGSFLDPGYDIRIDSETHYDAPSPKVGFRVIAVRKK